MTDRICPRCGRKTFNITERNGMLYGDCLICGHRASISKKSIQPVGKEDENPPVEYQKYEKEPFSIETVNEVITSLSRYSILAILVVVLLVFLSFSQIGSVYNTTQRDLSSINSDFEEYKGQVSNNFNEFENDIGTINTNINSIQNYVGNMVDTVETHNSTINVMNESLSTVEDELDNITSLVYPIENHIDNVTETMNTTYSLSFLYNDTSQNGTFSFSLKNQNSLHEVHLILKGDNVEYTDSSMNGNYTHYITIDGELIDFYWFGEDTSFTSTFDVNYSSLDFLDDIYFLVEYDNMFNSTINIQKEEI